MEIDRRRERVVLTMREESGCPIFRAGDRMAIQWPQFMRSASTGCCVEALASFLPMIRHFGASHKNLTCTLGSCRGHWLAVDEVPPPPPPRVHKNDETLVLEKNKKEEDKPKKEPFVLHLPKHIGRSLIRRAQSRTFRPGDIILEQGVKCKSLHVIKIGTVDVVRVSAAGETLLGEIGRGECFGEMSILTGEETSALIRAKSECQILFLEKHDLDELMGAHPALSLYFNQLLADRIRSANLRLREILDEGMVGQLSLVPIMELIQNLTTAHRSGTIELRYEDETATIGLRDGKVVFAIIGSVEAEEAFYRICDWRRGSFVFSHNEIPTRENIMQDTVHLLLEAMRRIDESAR